MSALQSWLVKPRARVHIDASVRWGGWMNILRQFSPGKRKPARPRLEVLDRLSLGGKKSLLLVSIEGRRLLVGVGDAAAPSITQLDAGRSLSAPRRQIRTLRNPRARKMVGS